MTQNPPSRSGTPRPGTPQPQSVGGRSAQGQSPHGLGAKPVLNEGKVNEMLNLSSGVLWFTCIKLVSDRGFRFITASSVIAA